MPTFPSAVRSLFPIPPRTTFVFWVPFLCWATVIHLFFMTRPSTVFWFVVSVVVYAIDAVVGAPAWISAFWSASHIFEECCKVITPSVADPNSSSTVVFELGSIGVVATIFHSIPRSIFKRPQFSTKFSVCTQRIISGDGDGYLQATAGTSVSSFEFVSFYDHFVSTFTVTSVKSSLWSMRNFFSSDQSSKLLPGELESHAKLS